MRLFTILFTLFITNAAFSAIWCNCTGTPQGTMCMEGETNEEDNFSVTDCDCYNLSTHTCGFILPDLSNGMIDNESDLGLSGGGSSESSINRIIQLRSKFQNVIRD